jgi:SAM-dependent methyltransferase
VRAIDEIQTLVRDRSALSSEQTEEILGARFAALPRRLVFALERWPALTESAVLDIGCSYGHCLLHFGPGSVGVDSDATQVEFCRSLGLDAQLADANELPDVGHEQFDYLWVSDVIEHLDAPRLFLRQLAPALKPDGRLLLFLTLAPSSRLVRAAMRRWGYRGFDAEAHHFQFTYDTACFMVERAGYRVVDAVAPRGIPRRASPRIYLEARRDAENERIAAEAERRNRGEFSR